MPAWFPLLLRAKGLRKTEDRRFCNIAIAATSVGLSGCPVVQTPPLRNESKTINQPEWRQDFVKHSLFSIHVSSPALASPCLCCAELHLSDNKTQPRVDRKATRACRANLKKVELGNDLSRFAFPSIRNLKDAEHSSLRSHSRFCAGCLAQATLRYGAR